MLCGGRQWAGSRVRIPVCLGQDQGQKEKAPPPAGRGGCSRGYDWRAHWGCCQPVAVSGSGAFACLSEDLGVTWQRGSVRWTHGRVSNGRKGRVLMMPLVYGGRVRCFVYHGGKASGAVSCSGCP